MCDRDASELRPALPAASHRPPPNMLEQAAIATSHPTPAAANSRLHLAPHQGRRIRGFEGARAPPEHGSAPSHCQKHLLKMKGKLDETPFQTDIQQSYGGFDVHIRVISVSNNCNLAFRFELNGHQWKSIPSRFDNSPPMHPTPAAASSRFHLASVTNQYAMTQLSISVWSGSGRFRPPPVLQ